MYRLVGTNLLMEPFYADFYYVNFIELPVYQQKVSLKPDGITTLQTRH